ncbi:four helix bundle protein [Dolichospermum flos-aquae]|uniref:four helix bundle protein n=1 Tax=Dolichospermum flosaquae TaxID=1166 RepID=UPI002D7F4878|nr:four helix bundle protein [Dolichospermum flos-aquae]
MAQGSVNELETHLILSKRVGLCSEKDIEMILNLLKEESRIIISLRDFQEINYPKKRTTEAQSTQRENFCISFGTFFLFGSLLLKN